MQQHASFVRVSGDRLRLVEADGRPCYFCGAHCYYLMVSRGYCLMMSTGA